MGHIQDRWYKKVVDPETKKVSRVKTDLYGTGLRLHPRLHHEMIGFDGRSE